MGLSPSKILVVDDELHIAASVTLALGRGFQVDAVTNGQEALRVLDENARGFGIVIVDHMMPGSTGSELIKGLQGVGFQGKCIVLSGYLTDSVEAGYRGLGVEYLIPKPFDVGALRGAVAASVRAIEDETKRGFETGE